jgi:hypothetical protein
VIQGKTPLLLQALVTALEALLNINVCNKADKDKILAFTV